MVSVPFATNLGDRREARGRIRAQWRRPVADRYLDIRHGDLRRKAGDTPMCRRCSAPWAPFPAHDRSRSTPARWPRRSLRVARVCFSWNVPSIYETTRSSRTLHAGPTADVAAERWRIPMCGPILAAMITNVRVGLAVTVLMAAVLMGCDETTPDPRRGVPYLHREDPRLRGDAGCGWGERGRACDVRSAGNHGGGRGRRDRNGGNRLGLRGSGVVGAAADGPVVTRQRPLIP